MNETIAQSPKPLRSGGRASRTLKSMLKNKYMYLLMLPGMLYYIVFRYTPMWGVIISFQDYQPFLGIGGSPWVGFKHFERLFTEPTFFMLFRNTIVLFLLNILIYFPVPILLALMLNEVRVQWFKRSVQTIIYIPFFMSWVIIVSLSYVLFTTERGIVNELLVMLGLEKISFLTRPEWFRPLYIMQVIWREAGWGTIIYLAAIAMVDPQLYEAGRMDGASRWRQIWHITLPSIRTVIVILLLLRLGDVLELGFDHVFLMANGLNREVAEIFDTYVYDAGIRQGQFSYSAAIGFFRSAVGLLLVVLTNWFVRRLGEEGLF